MRRIVTGGYFDGAKAHRTGPYAITQADGGRIVSVGFAHPGEALDAVFLLPTLVDAHVHIFLDGAELDSATRKQYLANEPAGFLAQARANADAALAAGIGIMRDAGDPHRVNISIRDALRVEGHPLRLRVPGPALHRPGRYGSFLGSAIHDEHDLEEAVRRMAEDSEDVKVLLTGVIDFTTGTVKGKPQFDAEAAAAIVRVARAMGRPAFAHCNGKAGLEVAIAAGFDSIEHGYLMDEESLRAMAGEGIAWTPTLAPVAAQRQLDPAISGFGPDILSVLDGILACHADAIARAAQLGVPLYCGSDAGGQGVPHGSGLIDEMLLMAQTGAPMETILAGATSLPRHRWGEAAADIVPGYAPDLIVLPADPVTNPAALRSARRLESAIPCKAIA